MLLQCVRACVRPCISPLGSERRTETLEKCITTAHRAAKVYTHAQSVGTTTGFVGARALHACVRLRVRELVCANAQARARVQSAFYNQKLLWARLTG